MLAYSDLQHAQAYVPSAGCKTRAHGRLRSMLIIVRFLSQRVHNPCHEIGGTYVVVAQAHKLIRHDLALLVDWFPNMNFVFVTTHQVTVGTSIVTADGCIDAELATSLGEKYGPYVWYICANTKLEDETTRVAVLSANNAIIGIMKPQRALVPFRHAYVVGKQVSTLRYNSPLWLQPWAKPTETVTMLNYSDGDIMLPCETAIEYEQKMYYWNRYVRTGTTPARPIMRGIGKQADMAIQFACMRDCVQARVLIEDACTE
jgi:hypothetical protein